MNRPLTVPEHVSMIAGRYFVSPPSDTGRHAPHDNDAEARDGAPKDFSANNQTKGTR